MSADSAPALGDTYSRRDTARFETKRGSDSGAGYERWRSTEHRPHTARQGTEDVYVPVHRLAAVVWCYDEDTPIEDILADLDGRDAHHTSEVKWLNFHDSPNLSEEFGAGLEVVGHGTHSEITQAQMRAWAEDAKRAVKVEVSD